MLDPSEVDASAHEISETTATPITVPPSIAQPTPDDGILAFRDYTLFPASRTLLRGGTPVSIGGRAFDLLVILLRNRGVVTPKNTITDHVWPATYLEESNLRFQIAALRKILGPDAELIKTVPGRGYLLAAEEIAKSAPANLDSSTGLSNSPGVRRAATGCTPAVLLEELLHSVGLLVASYGSVEGFLGALGSRQLPVAESLPARRLVLPSGHSTISVGTIA